METDFLEEQQTELDSLADIYPESFKKTGLHGFSMHIMPHPDNDNEPNHVKISFEVTYTETYPETMPKMELKSVKGLTTSQIQTLQSVAESCFTENAGLACMFSIITELQEWLVQNNIPADTSLFDQMQAQKELKERLQRLEFNEDASHTALDVHSIQDFDKSYKRNIGTPCTKENFEKWNASFMKWFRSEEARIEEERQKMCGDSAQKRDNMSGKEIFEQMTAQAMATNLEKLESKMIEEEKKIETKSQSHSNNSKAQSNPKPEKKKKSSKTKQDNIPETVMVSDETLFLDMDL